eukprot:5303213-Pyramimonas_sp.AAC.1
METETVKKNGEGVGRDQVHLRIYVIQGLLMSRVLLPLCCPALCVVFVKMLTDALNKWRHCYSSSTHADEPDIPAAPDWS